MNREYDVYISGPMTGLPDYNRAAFAFAAESLRKQGYRVFNPGEIRLAHQHLSDGDEWAEYMRICIAALAQSRTLYMLPGWAFSRGATIERALALQLGIDVVYAESEAVAA